MAARYAATLISHAESSVGTLAHTRPFLGSERQTRFLVDDRAFGMFDVAQTACCVRG